jgi:hypothetical protein
MVEAKEDVNKMKAELAIKNQELAAASKEAEALLKSISESTAIAEKGTCRCINNYWLILSSLRSCVSRWGTAVCGLPTDVSGTHSVQA